MIFLKSLHHICKIKNGPADTVKLVDNNPPDFSCPDIIHHMFKTGAVRVPARKSPVCIFNAGFPAGFISAIFKLAFYGYAVLFFD